MNLKVESVSVLGWENLGLAVLGPLAPCSDGSAAVWGCSGEGSVPVSS